MLVAGIVLLALNLRAAITSVSPVLDGLQRTLGLPSAAAGLLTALPVLCLGAFATLAPPLARRFGAETTLTGALCLITVGLLLRSAPGLVPLFSGTALAGAGIAVGNVLVPYVIKRSFPHAIGPLTGLATMLMAVSAASAAAATVPIELATGSRAVALAVWAVPALLGVPVWLLLALRARARSRSRTADDSGPGDDDAGPGDDGARSGDADGDPERPAVEVEPAAPVPDDRAARGTTLLRDPMAWCVAGFMGLQSLVFYVLASWLPAVLDDAGYDTATAGLMLSAAMLIGIPTGLFMPMVAARLRTQRRLILVISAFTAMGVGGLLLAPGGAWLWVVIAGLGTGSAFPVAFTLISVRAPDPATAARLSGMAQTTGYLLASTGPVTIGVVRDASGGWDVPLTVLLAMVVPHTIMGWLAGRDRHVRPRLTRPRRAGRTA